MHNYWVAVTLAKVLNLPYIYIKLGHTSYWVMWQFTNGSVDPGINV